MPAPTVGNCFNRGEIIAGRYQVQRLLCRGGTGEVYCVTDLTLDNQLVALKLLHPHLLRDSRTFQRFRNEVLLTRSLRHPNIVQMYDFGQDEQGQAFLTMQYIEGTSLGRVLRRMNQETLTFNEIALILWDTASGLNYAHNASIIHRDLKPDNLLVSTAGEVRLTDFGTARAMFKQGVTKPGERVGTPLYMAPEQFRGEQTDGRSDLYALGLLAYEFATGSHPFRGGDVMAVAHKHCSMPLPKMKNSKELPTWFVEFVRICTAKTPAERFESVQQAMVFIAGQFDVDQIREKTEAALGARIRGVLQLLQRKRTSGIHQERESSKFRKIPSRYKRVKRRSSRPSSIDVM